MSQKDDPDGEKDKAGKDQPTRDDIQQHRKMLRRKTWRATRFMADYEQHRKAVGGNSNIPVFLYEFSPMCIAPASRG